MIIMVRRGLMLLLGLAIILTIIPPLPSTGLSETIESGTAGTITERSPEGVPVITIFLNGKVLECDVPPKIIHDRVMVPLRTIAEALGGEVTWDALTQTIMVIRGNDTLFYSVNQNVAYKNNEARLLDSPPIIDSDRVLLPLRSISEMMGNEVTWDASSYTVTIK